MKKNGFSLMEVMVSMGLMGIVSMGVMQIAKQQSDTQKKASMNFDAQALRNNIITMVADEQACTETFKGMKEGDSINGSSGSEAVGIRNRNGSVVYPVEKTVAGADGTPTVPKNTYIKQIVVNTVKQLAAGSVNYQVSATVLTEQYISGVAQRKPIELQFNANLDNAGLIAKCYKQVDGLSKNGTSLVVSAEDDGSSKGDVTIKSINGGDVNINSAKNITLQSDEAVVVNGALEVDSIKVKTGPSTFSGNVTQADGTFFMESLNIGNGKTTANASGILTEALQVNGTLNVTGSTTISGSVSIENDIAVKGVGSFKSIGGIGSNNLDVTSNVSVADSKSLTAKSLYTDNISAATSGSNINVNSKILTGNNVDLEVGGTLIAKTIKTQKINYEVATTTTEDAAIFTYLYTGFASNAKPSALSQALYVKNDATVTRNLLLGHAITGSNTDEDGDSDSNIYLNPSSGNVVVGKAVNDPNLQLDVSGNIGGSKIYATSGVYSQNYIADKFVYKIDELDIMKLGRNYDFVSDNPTSTVPTGFGVNPGVKCDCDVSTANVDCQLTVVAFQEELIAKNQATCYDEFVGGGAKTPIQMFVGFRALPTYLLEVAGNITGKLIIGQSVVTQTFYQGSDIRFKENINPLSDSLENILKLNGYTFNLKGQTEGQVGLIAQEVEKVFPEMVTTDEKGMRYLAYDRLVAPLIEAVKEIVHLITDTNNEISLLKAENAKLKTELKNISNRLDRLEKK